MHNRNTNEMMRIPEITTEELQTAINKLIKGKSADSNGIRAEDIKACDDETREMVRQIFNEIVKQNEFSPEAWKKLRMKVIRKKGDVEDVGNYRPICLLPALYKLFMTILYSRFFQDSTKYKRKIRRDSEALSNNATSGESKCGQRQSTSQLNNTHSERTTCS